MTFGRKAVEAAGTAATVYGVWVHPRLWGWGATDEEVAGPCPGADLVPNGDRAAPTVVLPRKT